ncbi:DmpA family aminopeptidase [Sedimentibacter saalensis]|uniref:D-aminopeptidase n=1 Tax=Sedimentibacter saalensis TaxID=130788 RepID=A0A562JK35_9FIRM|nr:P1 family peptidase [Sedimentibacter saalensis]TWH83530.1 D-aminopeptidase [Sedimentibacter saalensis]
MGLDKDFGIAIGSLKKGKRNLITDVKGVKVGHVTLNDGNIKTGVTAVLPHEGNIFKEKVMASSCVINGFGKSMGILQIEELGTIETPIIMTNTLSVGTAATGLVKYMLEQNEDIGSTTGTVNCVVTECNDGRLNDIRGLHVKEEHVLEAIKNASEDFEEGAVGSGTGMVCYSIKGGIGSSSRIVELDNKEYTLGAIVMSNFGSLKDLIIGGDKAGERIYNNQQQEKDKGSIIMIIATDIPLSERQLKRVSKRAVIGLGRTGSYLGNGSGDICISFTTANILKHYSDTNIVSMKMLDDEAIDQVFRAAAEAVEESIISSMYHAETTVGINGNTRESLRDLL